MPPLRLPARAAPASGDTLLTPPRAHPERLLDGPLLTPATRSALRRRQEPEAAGFRPAVFTPAEFDLLERVSVQLVPHDPERLPLARRIDARLARGEADGWRYDSLPPDAQAYWELLAALPADFLDLEDPAQREALTRLQQTHPRAFEDLLAELTEGYYAQPQAQLDIGYVGFADARGWTRIGLDQLDPNEIEALKAAGLETP